MRRARDVLSENSLVSAADEDAFFHQLRLPNGTYKTTAHRRLSALDQWLVAQLRQREFQMLDVAVSSGVTTLDLLDACAAAGFHASVTACDLWVNARIRRILPGVELLLDSQGHVLQVSTPAGVKGRPHDPGGSVARRALAGVFVALERFCRTEGHGSPSSDLPVRLVSRRLRDRAYVEVVEHDLFQRRPDWSAQFDLVRAANILNPDYFDDAQIAEVVRSLGTYLRIGGRLLVARTDERNETAASLFERTDFGFRLGGRYGQGSVVEAVVLAAHRMGT